MPTFVLARSAHGRPTLQHVLRLGEFDMTACGTEVSQWSRAYQDRPIPQVLCIRCRKSGERVL